MKGATSPTLPIRGGLAGSLPAARAVPVKGGQQPERSGPLTGTARVAQTLARSRPRIRSSLGAACKTRRGPTARFGPF